MVLLDLLCCITYQTERGLILQLHFIVSTGAVHCLTTLFQLWAECLAVGKPSPWAGAQRGEGHITPSPSQGFPLNQSHPCQSQEAGMGSGSSPRKLWFDISSCMKAMLCRPSWACWYDFGGAHHRAGRVCGQGELKVVSICLRRTWCHSRRLLGKSGCSRPRTRNIVPTWVRRPTNVPAPFIPTLGRKRRTD